MYLMFRINVSRKYATVALNNQKPLLHEIFPQKRMMNKILFELDSRLSFAKLYPVYESIYNCMDKQEEEIPIPRNINSSDMMIMKKGLEKVRHKTKSVNRHLLELENTLLDKAAEMGDNDAVALLAFDVLKDPSNNSEDDVQYAKRLVKDLYQRKHHLTLKLTGDLALKGGDSAEAENYYQKFLELENDTFLAGEVYGQLGQVNFRKADLFTSEAYFLKSIQFSPLEYSVHSYFYLAQIYMNFDPSKARILMECCASQGFRESFKALGFLEMNYFKDLIKAQEWFKLGMELFELECFVGYFDCCVALDDWAAASKCINSMKRIAEMNVNYKPLVNQFIESRSKKVSKAQQYSPSSLMGNEMIDKATNQNVSVSKDNKWGL